MTESAMGARPSNRRSRTRISASVFLSWLWLVWFLVPPICGAAIGLTATLGTFLKDRPLI